MGRFLWTIYVQPINRILVFIGVLVLLWSLLCAHAGKSRWWKLINAVLFLVGFTAIVYATVCSRTGGAQEISLTPFHSFIAAKNNPEIYRSMLMNVFLFIPLGLSLPNILPQNRHPLLFSILFGLTLSVGVEWCQYRYGLGRCELDDISTNTLGTVIGTVSFVIAQTWKH